MSDENENDDTTASTPPAAAPRNGTAAAPKVTAVRPAQAVPKTMQNKTIDWAPENGWVSKMADDRLSEVAERAKLKGKTLRDVRITITRINEDQTEQKLATFAGDTVQGQNNPYTGSTGLGGSVVSPGEALFGVLRRFHYGSPVKTTYRVECWDQTNDGRMITSSFIQLAPSAQLDKMEQALNAAKPPTTFDPNTHGPGFGGGQGSFNPGVGNPGSFNPGFGSPQSGSDPMVLNLFSQMQDMQRRHYEEMRAMAEKAGQPVPMPPPGLGVVVETPAEVALKAQIEMLKLQIPKPKSDTEVLAEKMVAGFAAIIDKKFPTVGVGAALGVGVDPNAVVQKPLTTAQQMRAKLQEMEEELSLEDQFKKLKKKWGVGEAPELPEEPAAPVEPPKPEDKLPVNLVPIEGLQLFGQQFQSVSRKDGEEVGLGQQIIDHIMYNPGAQEQAMRFVMAVGEKVAEPLMNVLTRIGQATAVKPGGQSGVSGGGNGGQVGMGSNPPVSSHRAEVVNEVPAGAVDANGKPDDGGVI